VRANEARSAGDENCHGAKFMHSTTSRTRGTGLRGGLAGLTLEYAHEPSTGVDPNCDSGI
jgi:hypothetical protein